MKILKKPFQRKCKSKMEGCRNPVVERKKPSPVTIMLLIRSQKKPIQFQFPAWGFRTLFLVVILFAGVTGFSYLPAMKLNAALDQNQQLEAQLQQLTSEKLQMARDNQKLQQDSAAKEAQLGELRNISEQNRQELNELHIREQEIRNQLGLDPAEETPDQASAQVPEQATETAYSSEDAVSHENDPMLIPLTQMKLLSSRGNSSELIKQSLLTGKQEMAALSGEYDSFSSKIRQKQEAQVKRKSLRQQVAEYALQFVGGRYVYGGNDPHVGVDCSGFTKYVLSHEAGVSISRTAASQSCEGQAIRLNEARPGDLVFYTKGGSVNHVAMYIGDGKVIHASTEKTGIIVTPVNYRKVYKVVNVLG